MYRLILLGVAITVTAVWAQDLHGHVAQRTAALFDLLEPVADLLAGLASLVRQEHLYHLALEAGLHLRAGVPAEHQKR